MKRALRYLIVDDNDDHAALIQRNLRKTSPESTIDRVCDGFAALQFLRQKGPYAEAERPDLMLLDLKMPGMDGIEVLKRIKSDETLRGIPVVMLSTSAAESDRRRAYATYVNSYLVKPMEFSGFRTLVKELCHYWGDVNYPACSE